MRYGCLGLRPRYARSALKSYIIRSLVRDRPPIPPPWETKAFDTHLLRGSSPLKVPGEKSKMEIEFEKRGVWDVRVRTHLVVLGVNGVVVGRNGLILWENEATDSRKVSRHLPGPKYTIKT